MPDVERQLRAVAGRLMRNEQPGHTWQPTDLVSEVYLRLARQKRLSWESHGHFVALASKLMRQILVDHARAKNAKKRGAGIPMIPLDDELTVARGDAPSLTTVIALDDALERLSELDEKQAQIVEMRLFGGFTIDEVASSLQVLFITLIRNPPR